MKTKPQFGIDIETDSYGEVLVICVYGFNNQGIKIRKKFHEWITFFEWSSGLEGQPDFWAHNGFGFDFINMLYYSIIQHDECEKHIHHHYPTVSGSSLIALTIKTKTDVVLRFRDTIKWFPGSLEKVSEKFGFGYKKDAAMDEFKSHMEDAPVEAMEKYCMEDAKAVFEIGICIFDNCKKFLALYGTEMRQLPLTVPGFAKKVFMAMNGDEWIRDPMWLDKMSRPAFRGGVVEHFGVPDSNYLKKAASLHDAMEALNSLPSIDEICILKACVEYVHCHHNVTHFDACSMYPSSYRDIPTAPNGTMRHHISPYLKQALLEKEGIARIRFTQTRGEVPEFIDVFGTNRLAWSGESVEDISVVRSFLDRDMGEIEILEMATHSVSGHVLGRFANAMQKLRTEKGPLAEIAKLCANSLYGKLAEREEKMVSLLIDKTRLTSKHVEAIANNPCFVFKDNLSFVTFPAQHEQLFDDIREDGMKARGSEKKLAPEHDPGIASSSISTGLRVTSRARSRLLSIINEYKLKAIYSDTDSIFVSHDSTFPKHLISEGKELGMWNCETSRYRGGRYLFFTAFGKKSYFSVGIRDGCLEWKIRHKGIPNRELILAGKLTEKGARFLVNLMLHNESGPVEYFSPLAYKSMLREAAKDADKRQSPSFFRRYFRHAHTDPPLLEIIGKLNG